ncbi:MAG: glycoside hydrolase [Oscillospiraceae bacterium]|jgi:hypothetical protein|nr:glycoside hydrolase [Oscillospiraceae bacterium]
MWFFREIVTYLICALQVLGIQLIPVVTPTPLEGRLYAEEAPVAVTPDESSYLSVRVLDEGCDIYAPDQRDSSGYRYGPSMILNADGSIDAWFAAPGAFGQWDWITYRHSPDGGKSWTDEKVVLQPTPDSPDFYSVCDPGVVYFGGYYYLGYTSTTNEGGVDNHAFVARSRTPDGPYEKWNGAGWGGKPQPIVAYTGSSERWGIGEPSFVVKGDTLYIYYTLDSVDESGTAFRRTNVCLADAADENWPATIYGHQAAIAYTAGGSDSADVKYIEDYGKFIAVSTAMRMGEDSYVAMYESNDGLTFFETERLYTHVSWYCHNSGMLSRPNGHIRIGDKLMIGYAYGRGWGNWATRLHEIEISLSGTNEFSDAGNPNTHREIEKLPNKPYNQYIGISAQPGYHTLNAGESMQAVVWKIENNLEKHKILWGDITLSGYDSNIIAVSGKKITARNPGETFVTAQWGEHKTIFLVKVN